MSVALFGVQSLLSQGELKGWGRRGERNVLLLSSFFKKNCWSSVAAMQSTLIFFFLLNSWNKRS